ncbi:hypothetical protein IQ273_10500 [Nodosilinea sp. LEGE 07298]|nr:hypothetical protein [Nodosilinea sp. LEGE 07298]
MLLEALNADTLLADKGYDTDKRVIERLECQSKTVVIPPKGNRKAPRDYDRELYKARHLFQFASAVITFRSAAIFRIGS